jgi:signal transduction histidine kinase
MRILGWAAFAATCILFVLQGIFLAASDYALISYEVLADQVFPLLGLGSVIGAGVGALIVSRYPRSIVGWLLLISQLGNVIGIAADAYLTLLYQGLVDVTFQRALELTQAVFDAAFSVAIISILFMIAPDGRLLSRGWRLMVGLPIAALVLKMVVIWIQFADDLPLGGPAGDGGIIDLLFFASFILLLLGLLFGAAAMLIRLHRSTGQRRLQLLWISPSAAAFSVTFVIFVLAPQWFVIPGWILPTATCLAYISFTIGLGVAVLRYRLFDIDVILSRAITLSVLAVFVTAGYVAIVVAIGAVLSAIGAPGSSLYWPSLVATAVVAVAFQPVRRRVLRLADQLVYGSRAAPYEALASLSRRLADSPSPDALPARVAEATGRAVGAARILVWLGVPGGRSQMRSATWPDGGSTLDANGGPAAPPTGVDSGSLVLAVLDMDEQVGSIEVTMPPGRTLRTFERHFLEDVAAQAGVAFRNALLQAELAARIEQGQDQSAELAASRRRLLGAEDEARERLAGAIRRGVVPHLAAVEAQLSGGLGTGDHAVAGGQLEPLIAETEHALEELRSVCRGVFPALLERRGLVPALSAQLDATHPLTLLTVDDSADRRVNRAAEAAGYQFCIEVAPVDQRSVIELQVTDNHLVATVSGGEDWATVVTGVGPAAQSRWQHARDRVAALDGEIRVQRTATGLLVTAEIPLADQQDREPAMAAQVASSRSGPKADFGT